MGERQVEPGFGIADVLDLGDPIGLLAAGEVRTDLHELRDCRRTGIGLDHIDRVVCL
jgi:hypothetical protein